VADARDPAARVDGPTPLDLRKLELELARRHVVELAARVAALTEDRQRASLTESLLVPEAGPDGIFDGYSLDTRWINVPSTWDIDSKNGGLDLSRDSAIASASSRETWDRVAVGKRLRELRLEAGWTQKEVEQRAKGKIKQKQLSDWENGKHLPSSQNRQLLCSRVLFDVELHFLLTGEGPRRGIRLNDLRPLPT
jgi:helix-turn-helix protein